jgi:hypothetical protein
VGKRPALCVGKVLCCKRSVVRTAQHIQIRMWTHMCQPAHTVQPQSCRRLPVVRRAHVCHARPKPGPWCSNTASHGVGHGKRCTVVGVHRQAHTHACTGPSPHPCAISAGPGCRVPAQPLLGRLQLPGEGCGGGESARPTAKDSPAGLAGDFRRQWVADLNSGRTCNQGRPQMRTHPQSHSSTHSHTHAATHTPIHTTTTCAQLNTAVTLQSGKGERATKLT